MHHQPFHTFVNNLDRTALSPRSNWNGISKRSCGQLLMEIVFKRSWIVPTISYTCIDKPKKGSQKISDQQIPFERYGSITTINVRRWVARRVIGRRIFARNGTTPEYKLRLRGTKTVLVPPWPFAVRFGWMLGHRDKTIWSHSGNHGSTCPYGRQE